jgi:predicted transcriptional regulator
MCARPLSVAEISAYLQLPFSVVSVLVGELLAAGLVRVRQTRAQQRQEAAEPDIATLKALIDGLQRL